MTLLRTYPFLIPLIVGVLCETVKIMREGITTGDWSGGFFRPGGMPSTHSAFVTSLLIIVWVKLGMESIEFAIAFVFAAIVWYDASHSRKVIGEQAAILNRLQKWKHFGVRVGHSVMEVIVGIIFGGVLTWLGIWIAG